MKRIPTLSIAVPIVIAVAAPAQAGLLSGANLLNVAKIVLNNRAVLNKASSQCGNQVSLQPQDNLLMEAAGAAVQKALPVTQYAGLLGSAGKLANVQAASPTFCQTTSAKKPGLLGGIAEAAGKLGVGGGLLGGGSGSGAAGVLGNILGNAQAPKN
jgi:hypothetical protein